MKITTRVEFQMTEDGFEKVHEESYEHDGSISELKKKQTVEQVQKPPSYLRGPLQQVTSEAMRVYDQNRAPFSQTTLDALELGRGRAMGGGGIDTSRNLLRRTAEGEFLNPQDEIAASIKNILPQVSSTFASAGQKGNPLETMAIANAAANAAANIRGRERGLQQQAAFGIPGMEFADVDQLLRLGNIEETQPFSKIGTLAGILQGAGGRYGSSSQPYFRQPLASAAGGALTGLKLGGPVGAGIGGGLGLLGLM